MILYKYQGAGNDFLIADNRDGSVNLSPARIAEICDRRYGVGADGLMLLETAPQGYDFKMLYFNSDGTGGMMCGNGGRCIVAFADFCGIHSYNFLAVDGPHKAEILSRDGNTLIVKLKMVDVTEMKFYDDPEICGCFLDTGTRHLVCPVTALDTYDVVGEGRRLRYRPEFEPKGVNVDFIQAKGDTLKVRTYEKGVEDETYACGTGITASAIVAWHFGNGQLHGDTRPTHQAVRARRDNLAVDFTPTSGGAVDVYLTGPATYVAKVII